MLTYTKDSASVTDTSVKLDNDDLKMVPAQNDELIRRDLSNEVIEKDFKSTLNVAY